MKNLEEQMLKLTQGIKIDRRSMDFYEAGEMAECYAIIIKERPPILLPNTFLSPDAIEQLRKNYGGF